MDFIEACRKFIEIDSTPANGNWELANYAADLCRRAGLHVEVQEDSQNGLAQANLIARPLETRPDDEILLQTHFDTCDPGNYALWTRTGANPFNGSLYLDTLYGLGAATKLDFLCKLSAALQLRGKNLKRPYVLVGTFGEEIGMPGAIKLIRRKKINAKTALVGEPTDLRLVHAGKGFASVEIEVPFSDEEKNFRRQHDLGQGTTTQSRVFTGKPSHSADPTLGDSAINKLLDCLIRLPEGLAVMEIEGGTSYNTVPGHAVLEIDIVADLQDAIVSKITRIQRAIQSVEQAFKAFVDHDFDPPSPTLNIGLIRTYEDYVKISGCCRLPPSVSDEVYEEWMAILRAACNDVGAIFRVTDHKQPFRTPLDEPLIKICQEQLEIQGRPSVCGTQSVANEANVFSRFGISCVVFGPGIGIGNSHAPNEHVKVDDLFQATQFYKGVLERVCL